VFDLDIMNDGRIVLLIPARPLPPQSITIVQNWQSLLVRK
jgi:hypothetical protein